MCLIILSNFYIHYKIMFKRNYYIFILDLLIIYMCMFDNKKNKFAFKILR